MRCLACGQPIIRTGKPGAPYLYCAACRGRRDAHGRRTEREHEQRWCLGCGKPLVHTGKCGVQRRRCDECHPPHVPAVVRLARCAACDEPFTTTHGTVRYCSKTCKECASEWNKRVPCAGGCGRRLLLSTSSLPAGQSTCRACRALRPKIKHKPHPRLGDERPCPVCGDPWRPAYYGLAHGWTKTCSKSCGGVLREGGTLIPGAKDASPVAREQAKRSRRRATMRAAVVEAVEPRKVFERDHWRCHICRKRIDRRLSGRHRMGPTLDHLIPLARGGEHSYANVAAAHRVCNSRRRVGGTVQLALIG